MARQFSSNQRCGKSSCSQAPAWEQPSPEAPPRPGTNATEPFELIVTGGEWVRNETSRAENEMRPCRIRVEESRDIEKGRVYVVHGADIESLSVSLKRMACGDKRSAVILLSCERIEGQHPATTIEFRRDDSCKLGHIVVASNNDVESLIVVTPKDGLLEMSEKLDALRRSLTGSYQEFCERPSDGVSIRFEAT